MSSTERVDDEDCTRVPVLVVDSPSHLEQRLSRHIFPRVPKMNYHVGYMLRSGSGHVGNHKGDVLNDFCVQVEEVGPPVLTLMTGGTAKN